MIRKRNFNEIDAENLANELADKPYGAKFEKDNKKVQDDFTRTSISIPLSMLEDLENLAIKNKRSGKKLKTVSAIIRAAVYNFISNK